MTRKALIALALCIGIAIFIGSISNLAAAPAAPSGTRLDSLENSVRPNEQNCNGTPIIDFATANPATIFPGQVTTLSWGKVWNAQAAFLQFPDGRREGIGTPGSRQVNPTQTTTYFIIGVCGPNTIQFPIVVNVQSTPGCNGAPSLNGFSANPPVINNGQSSNLSWGPVLNADSVQLSSQFNGGSGVPTPGSSVVRPNQTTTYYLTAWCRGSSAQAQVTITVNFPQPPTPVPPPSNPNQVQEIRVERLQPREFKVTVRYFWNGEDAPALIQTVGYNGNRQQITNRPTTNIIAGFVKFVIQNVSSPGGNGSVTAINSCIVGRSGTELACLSVPVQ